MPPKAPPPTASAAAASSKGKGKEDNASSTTTSAMAATTSTAASSTSGTSTPATAAAAVASTAPQRRQPIGKVIHYFADSQSQGYDGAAFQDAYRGVLQKLQETQEVQAANAESQKGGHDEADASIAELKDEDLQAFITLTGLSGSEAKGYFRRAKSTQLEDAASLYLQLPVN